jgi:iron complex transport system ATP-binding protein
MLQLQNYSSSILKNIHFRLKPKQSLIILGSNGAGKSTLAKLLCGITPSPTLLNGKPISIIKAKERTKQINYIPPKLEIFDEYITLEEYLNLSRLYTRLESKNMLKLLEIEHLKHKPCQQLSSGEQQLTMIASAVLHNAKITIFDEPTANLDPKKSQDIFSLLKSDIFQNKIIITHDLNLAYHLGYDIMFIKEGKIDFFDNSHAFFNESNLNEYFGTSVKMTKENIVIQL